MTAAPSWMDIERTEEEIRRYVDLSRKLILKRQEHVNEAEADVFSQIGEPVDLTHLDNPDVVWIPKKIYAEIIQRFDTVLWRATPETYTDSLYKDIRAGWTSITKARYEEVFGIGSQVLLIIEPGDTNRDLVHVIPTNGQDEQIVARDLTGDPNPIHQGQSAIRTYYTTHAEGLRIAEIGLGVFVNEGSRHAVYREVDGFEEKTSGRLSITDPGASGGDGETASSPTSHRAGLSDIISAPQEYVLVKLLYGKNGEGYPADQRDAVKAAIDEFERAGAFEDRRKPPLVIGRDGEPTDERNPERYLTHVPFQGEHNLYYRHLVIDHGISPFTSRTTGQFEALNTERPPAITGLDSHAVRQFISIHSECAKIFKRTIYNDSYVEDRLYLDFCRLFITWMAIIRTLNERIRTSTDIDHMGRHDLVNLLYSYGFHDLNKMTDVYQRRFLKKVSSLLASKGTDKVFKDILNIFNLGDILKVWKHHVVKYYPHRIRRVSYNLPAGGWSAATPGITLGTTSFSASGMPPFRRLERIFRERSRPGLLHGISHIEILREQRNSSHRIVETTLLIRRAVSTTDVKVRYMDGSSWTTWTMPGRRA